MGTGICWSARDLLPHYNLLNNPLRCDCPHFSDECTETRRVYIACPKSIGNNYYPSELFEKLSCVNKWITVNCSTLYI